MSSDDDVLRTQEAASGNVRLCCPIYGCRRVYTDKGTLENHIKDHQIPAQSVPGKVLQCSMVGCSCSFPDMQNLMLHMRHHHKPNIYFLCESCRTKLRSYRGLLTHLHTCSKVSRSKIKPAEALTPQQNTSSSATPRLDTAPQPEPPALPLMFPPPTITTDIPNQIGTEVTPLPGSHGSHKLFPLPPLLPPPPPDIDGPGCLPEIPMLIQNPESSLSVALPLPPSSSAVTWKKNQGIL